MNAIPLEEEIHYPDTDGEPMGETDSHIEEIVCLRVALRERFRGTPDVWVASNLLLYYREGDPTKVVVPDVFVARVAKKRRRKYLLWEEERGPFLVVEFTSAGTMRKDISFKRKLYEELGVDEYFLFDPCGEYLVPPLQGFRLVRGRYQPIPPETDGSLASATLGVHFRLEEDYLRLTDDATGEPLPRPDEMADSQSAAEARAAAEAEARRRAEERAQKLEEELARLRAHHPIP